MTTLEGTADAIRAEASKLDPLKVLVTLIALIPFLLGWSARIVWVLVSLLWGGAVVGWRKATEQIDDRSAERGSS